MNEEYIKYIGSKRLILPHILNLIPDDVETVLDAFSGSTRVSQALAKDYNVISNDLGYYSQVLAEAYLLRTKPDAYYQEIIDGLNALEPISAWFSLAYLGLEKKPYQRHTLNRLDAIRKEIDKFNGIDKSVLLASLLLALEKVDSNLGHFSSYLRDFSKRSYGDLLLKVPACNSKRNHQVFREDIFKLLERDLEYDLVYFDPPYGSNNNNMPSSRVRYQQYYHLLDTIVRNDEPEIFGKVGRRRDAECGVFEEFRKDGDKFIVQDSIEDLLNKTRSKYIMFSYNNNGRLPIPDLLELLGDCKILQIPHKSSVMSNMSWEKGWERDLSKNTEYLFLKEN